MTQEQKEWHKGFACACAIIIRYHGMTVVEVEEALVAGGLSSIKRMKNNDVDPYDQEVLIPAIQAIVRRKKRKSI